MRLTGLLYGITSLLALGSAQAHTPTPPADFLRSLCATWVGEGVAEGRTIADVLSVRWGKDKFTLIADLQATAGDGFSARTELRNLPGTASFVAVERNNGRWPLREFTGTLRGQRLQLEEKAAGRHVVLDLSLLDATTLEVLESMVESGKTQDPFVRIRFKMDPLKGRCAA
jgi:hypothetical protein